MLQQVHSILKEEGKKSVKVLSSDAGVFVSISETTGQQKMYIWTHFQVEAS